MHVLDDWVGYECLLSHLSMDTKGYVQVSIRIDGEKYNLRAHRVVYEGLYGPIPDGMDLAHLCGNRACIELMHLEPKTRVENHQDMIAHGRATRGEDNTEAVLTEDDVRDIWFGYEPGVNTHQQLADEKGVDRSEVSQILRGEKWAYFTSKLPPGGGRRAREGGRHGGPTSITAEIARAIASEYHPGQVSYQDLAARYGTSSGVVKHIINRNTWAHATEGIEIRRFDRHLHATNQHS